MRTVVFLSLALSASAFLPSSVRVRRTPALMSENPKLFDSIAAAFGASDNDYPALSFPMGYSGDKYGKTSFDCKSFPAIHDPSIHRSCHRTKHPIDG